MTDRPPANSDEEPRREETASPLIIPSETLLQGRKEVWIEHGEEMYRLRLTSSGKLYLSK